VHVPIGSFSHLWSYICCTLYVNVALSFHYKCSFIYSIGLLQCVRFGVNTTSREFFSVCLFRRQFLHSYVFL
jgi:hypothetical protein